MSMTNALHSCGAIAKVPAQHMQRVSSFAVTAVIMMTLCGTCWAQETEESETLYANVVVPNVVGLWISYLQTDEVQSILQLDGTQQKACHALSRPRVIISEAGNPDARVEATRESFQRTQRDIQTILSPEQFITLRQIELQNSSEGRWNHLCETLVRADVAASIQLTQAQCDEIVALEPRYEEAKEKVKSQIRKGLATGRDLHLLRQRFNPLDVLSTEQRLQWRKMLGTPRHVTHRYRATPSILDAPPR